MRLVAGALVVAMLACDPPADSYGFDVADAASADAAAAGTDAGMGDTNDWRRRPIYMVMTDRFFDGDTQNDRLGDPDCFDPNGVRAFHGGDFAGLASPARLDYLDDLGVGAVWITPVYEQIGCGYHGYWADFRLPDPGNLEPKLGTPADFQHLIEQLHQHEIRLMLDMVVNHAGRGAAIASQRPAWFHPTDGCANLGPADVYCPLNGLPDFAHEKPDVAAYVTALSTSLAQRFAIDGVRMDTAKHVPRSYFHDSWFPAMRAVRPDLFVVAEVFDASSSAAYTDYYDAGFDSVFQFAVREGLIDTFARGASTNALADRVADAVDTLGIERATHTTLFLDNHDVPRWSEMSDAAPAETLRRYRLALAALFTLPGIPQLYYGDELGFTGSWPDNRRTMPSWVWTATSRAGDHSEALPDPSGTYAWVQTLSTLRAANPALWRGSYCELWRQNAGAPLYVFFRGDGDNRIVVAFNNGDAATEVRFRLSDNPGLSTTDREALTDGTVLHDLLGGGAPATLRIENGRGVVTLPGKTVGLYRAP